MSAPQTLAQKLIARASGRGEVAPGEGRDPAPGTQAQLGELMQAWIDSGAECPR